MLEQELPKVRKLACGLKVFAKYKDFIDRGWYDVDGDEIDEARFVFDFGFGMELIVYVDFKEEEYEIHLSRIGSVPVYLGCYKEYKVQELLHMFYSVGKNG